MPIAITIIIQVIAAVHVLKTGRDMRWLWLIVFLPVAGALAYLIIEVLPSLQQNPGARRALRKARSAIDPDRGVREGSLDYERSQTVETSARLADELTRAGRYDEAIEVCTGARQGFFEDDPKILLSQANAEFAGGRYPAAIATLDYLREKNPTFRSADGHLVYARALEESGDTKRALEEYDALVKYYPGAEARARHALLFKKLGETERAKELFAALLKDARLAPKHFRRSQQEWISLAERELPR